MALAVISHTSSKPISKRHLMRDTTEIGLDRWQALDHEAWGLIVAKLQGKSQRPKPKIPLPHQARAISKAKEHFVRNKAARGRLIMPCGTGKSLTAYWIAEALHAKLILVAVPSNGGKVTIFSAGARAGTGVRPNVLKQVGFCPGTTINIDLRTDAIEILPEESEELQW